MKQYVVGVDIGGTACKLGIFAQDGGFVGKWEFPTVRLDTEQKILDGVAEAIWEGCLARGIAKQEICGVGIGIPGPVDKNGIVYGCVNLNMGIVPVQAEMSRRLSLPVCVGNDANMAALGEMWQGGGGGKKNVVMVTLGTGVGGGIITEGRITYGKHGAAGEIGHMQVCTDEEESCGCGRKGCLEQYVSATGLVRMTKRYMQKNLHMQKSPHMQTRLSMDNLHAKQIFDAAKRADPLALCMVEKYCDALGRGLANIAVVVDPEIFVIGGGVSRAGEILLKGVTQAYAQHAFAACRHTEIALAKLGNDAGIYGAACLLLSR